MLLVLSSPQAMSLKMQPPVAPKALENLSLMVDDIWYMAGDLSTDTTWYTKRGVLAAIYTSTGHYQTQLVLKLKLIQLVLQVD